MAFDLLVEVAELGVPVRALLALDRLGVALQAEALLAQQFGDGVPADPVSGRGQFPRQVAQRLRCPAQRRHRIPALVRLDQRQQRGDQSRVQIGRPLAATTGTPDPAQRLRAGLQLLHPVRYGALAHPGGPGHHPDPAVTQHPGLSPGGQPPLPFVQVRKQGLELRGQRRLGVLGDSHSTSSCPDSRTDVLIIDEPLTTRSWAGLVVSSRAFRCSAADDLA